MTVRLCCTGLAESGIMPPMKYWEIVADKLSAAGLSWGYCSTVTRDGWRSGDGCLGHKPRLLPAPRISKGSQCENTMAGQRGGGGGQERTPPPHAPFGLG